MSGPRAPCWAGWTTELAGGAHPAPIPGSTVHPSATEIPFYIICRATMEVFVRKKEVRKCSCILKNKYKNFKNMFPNPWSK